MTQALLAHGDPRRVLEVGTGSGYQAAVLTTGRPGLHHRSGAFKPLLLRAQKLFRQLRLRNILSAHLDGAIGWREHAPYDAIITTAAPEVVL